MNIAREFEYLIVGAGPAGLQLGYFLEKSNRNYLILEAGDCPGTFFKKYPRHKRLISINKIYTGYDDSEINLRWDWNSLLSDSEEMLFKNYSKEYLPHADDFVRYLGDFVTHFNLKVKCNCQAVKIFKNDKFVVVDKNGNIYSTMRLIIATGFSKPYVPLIPGIELTENYTDVSIDPEDFANQKVLIIGKGNSGFETADNLLATASLIHIVSPNPVSMAWKTKYVGHLRAVNNNILDTYQLKSQNIILDAAIEKIEYHKGQYIATFAYSHVNDEVEELIYDRIIVCTGFRFDDSIFDDSCKPKLVINNRFPSQTSEWESSNVSDLYFVGILSHMRDYKKKQSGFIHGFRYNVRVLHHILEHKYYGRDLPCHFIDATPENLTQVIIQRVNQSSGLWQQTGFLCDCIIISENGKTAQYFTDYPADYIHDSDIGQHEHYYTVTLEFGLDIIFASSDLFSVERIHKDDADRAALSSFIHPIIRRFRKNELITEHHIIEDVASEWLEEVHIKPLIDFLSRDLGKIFKGEDLVLTLPDKDK
ncbi:MAG: NAD(P)-binding domain-containing protein [Mastigocoleus sp. MO_167.B18]|nr:NAD(P)-binding domain-containing protein [Mastigocoleus sp. MO_167.B18]